MTMDNVIIITEILKYFNFQELCIAERINPNFKSCVKWELHRLKCVDFDRIFTGSWIKVLNKIEACCSGLRHLKNFSGVTSFVVEKQCLDSPDPFTEEDFKENFFILLRSLEKLTCLEIDSSFIEIFGWGNALNLVENFRNLKQLGAAIDVDEISNNELRERIEKVIIGHSALTKLIVVQSYDLWIYLSSCRNLTDFTLRLCRTMGSAHYEQLYALLDVNLNLESLDISNVSHDNLQLIEKLMRLPKLKSLTLRICQFDYTQLDDDLSYHRIMKDLYFVSLQNIEVYCEDSESQAKFVAFLLSRSPLLKEISLEVDARNSAFHRILFNKFPLYDRIEIFKLDFLPAPDDVQSFIHNEISKMVNLKCLWINKNSFCSGDTEKISKLRKLKCLRWSAKPTAALKMMSSSSLLEGMNLYNKFASPESFDLILDQCPNLRYFAVDILDAEQIRKLPLKAPNLQYFLIDKCSSRHVSPIKDALTYAVQNLPNLRQLFIPEELYDSLLRLKPVLYNSLLGLEPVKRLSRQKRLSIITGWHCPSPYGLINEWIHRCCEENPST